MSSMHRLTCFRLFFSKTWFISALPRIEARVVVRATPQCKKTRSDGVELAGTYMLLTSAPFFATRRTYSQSSFDAPFILNKGFPCRSVTGSFAEDAASVCGSPVFFLCLLPSFIRPLPSFLLPLPSFLLPLHLFLLPLPSFRGMGTVIAVMAIKNNHGNILKEYSVV
jgi:hypothetical protein